MSLSLHTIKPAHGSTRRRKVVGRGNASGHGTFSGRGTKGQRARTGGTNKLKRLGFKKILAQTPKSRGFRSAKPKNRVVNIKDINQAFKDGARIDVGGLVKVGLIDSGAGPVKILGQGELRLKNLEFTDMKMSASARAQVEKMGGKIK
jgi:large subunit ribosomal protein L15